MTPKYEQEAPLTTGLHNLNESDYLHSIRAGLIVPLLQSVTIGILVTIIASLILEYNGIADWFRWSSIVGLVTVLTFFLNGLRLWRYLVRLVERELQIDLTPNDNEGIPEPRTVKVDITSGSKTYPKRDWFDLPYADRLPRFCAGVLGGMAMTHKVWVSGNSRDKLFSSGEFSALMDALLDQAIIELRNPRDVSRGYKLTDIGQAVFEGLAGGGTPPLKEYATQW